MNERTIPVYHALLPRAAALFPYLERIDVNRWYANRGELVTEFEARLGERLAGSGAKVISAATGTAAIEGAIFASAGRATVQRPLALIPAYTFVATASAVEACGYAPYLLDVDLETWALDPERLANHPILARTGIVVTVAPYGRAIPQAPWAAFARRTGIPVVIDAAAAFEALLADPARLTGEIPVALSFQATKAYGTGEGGAVVWSDFDGLTRVARALNFGILYKRESTQPGTNGKLSEYHAAVGLAALDAWDATARMNRSVVDDYRARASAHGVAERVVLAPAIASNYALLDAGSAETADALISALRVAGIESRRWYGRGLHREPYLQDAERDALPITDRIAPSLLGLPIASDIAPADVERVVSVAGRVLEAANRLAR